MDRGARRGAKVRGVGLVLVALATCGTVAGCSSSSSSGSDGAAPTTSAGGSTTTLAPAPVPKEYVGPPDDFYRVPDPLPKGRPGELIRVQHLAGGPGTRSVRVMYHSTDQTGADRAVTGIVTYRTGKAPKAGWPVLSTAHGTTGIASPCAPSRTGRPAPDWGVHPAVTAMTDYIGLGPQGELHAYLSKADEGNAVIDIVRAARNLPDAHAGRRWISIGHSQGGHGALAAHELASERAPELDLVATVALSPAAMLDKVYGGIDPIVTAILTMMGVYGAQAEHPDVDLADYFSPEALAKAKDVFEHGCLGEITDQMVGVAMRGAFRRDPRRTAPLRAELLAQDVGSKAVDGVPLFLASGTEDDRVVTERFLDTVQRVCATGQQAEVHVVPGATHDSILRAEAANVRRFITDALAGKPPRPSSCGQPQATWTDPPASP